MTDPTKPNGKFRQCWNCGGDMGFIENRYYDSSDVCGKTACNRALSDMYAEQRQAEHDAVDDRYGW